MKLSIFTPTYNRVNILKRTYKSLLNQTSMLFEWIIVDDGSDDKTKEVVLGWIREKKVNIKYFKQNNQGKMIAHNKGLENAKGEIFVCLDSDDYLVSNAVEMIINTWGNLRESDCIGIVSLKVFQNLNPVGTKMPKNIQYVTLSDLYNKYRFRGDTMLIYRTDLLKQFLFPKIEGEKFIPEAYVYDQLDLLGRLYILNEKLYVCEYLLDGYSANIRKIIKENPKGYTLFAKQRMDIQKGFYKRLKATSQYVIGNWLSKNRNFINETNNKHMVILSVPFAFIVYMIKYFKKE